MSPTSEGNQSVEVCIESDDHSAFIVRAMENRCVIRSRHADFARANAIETRAAHELRGRARQSLIKQDFLAHGMTGNGSTLSSRLAAA